MLCFRSACQASCRAAPACSATGLLHCFRFFLCSFSLLAHAQRSSPQCGCQGGCAACAWPLPIHSGTLFLVCAVLYNACVPPGDLWVGNPRSYGFPSYPILGMGFLGVTWVLASLLHPQARLQCTAMRQKRGDSATLVSSPVHSRRMLLPLRICACLAHTLSPIEHLRACAMCGWPFQITVVTSHCAQVGCLLVGFCTKAVLSAACRLPGCKIRCCRT